MGTKTKEIFSNLEQGMAVLAATYTPVVSRLTQILFNPLVSSDIPPEEPRICNFAVIQLRYYFPAAASLIPKLCGQF
jgi:hypothetical protein